MAVELKDPVVYASAAPLTPESAEAQKLEGTDPLVFEGSSVGVGARLLLKDQVDASQNGLWEVIENESFGGAGAFGEGAGDFGEGEGWQLERPADADTSEEVKHGMLVQAMNGSTIPRSSWLLTSPDPVEVGTDDQEFVALVGTNEMS